MNKLKARELLVTFGGIDICCIGHKVFIGRLQVMAFNEQTTERSAQQNGGDQTECRCCGTNRFGEWVAHFHKIVAIGQGSAVSANHRDSACQQSIRRLQAGGFGNADTDAVLDDGNNAADQPVDQQQFSAALEQLKARAQTDGRKECQHKHALERVIEYKGKASGGMPNPGDKHKEEAANDRCGNAEFREEMYFAHQNVSDEKKDGG